MEHKEAKHGEGHPAGHGAGHGHGHGEGNKPTMSFKQEEDFTEDTRLGFDKLKEDLPTLVNERKPFTIVSFAEMYGVSELEVCYALPEDMRVITSGSNFEKIWEELTTWEKTTAIIQHKGSAFEISTKLSKGMLGHGYYNIMGGATFGGHIKADNIHTIVFSSMPFMGLESYSVLFFDKVGGLMLSIYAGRENRAIIESVKQSFLKMRDEYKQEGIKNRKSLIVYSTLTGNTKKLAEAVKEVVPNSEMVPIEEVPDNLEDYYFISVGYWVDRGLPDGKSKKFIKSLKNANVGFFGTLGAYPDSPHAKGCIRDTENMLRLAGKNNNVLGSFLSLGKIDPKIIDYMGKFLGENHPVTPERRERWKKAETHPDEQDIENVQNIFKGFVARLGL